MDDDAFGAFVCTLAFCLLFSWFGPVWDFVDPANWKIAEEACSTMDGINRVEPVSVINFEVYCNNGVVITIRDQRGK